MAEKYNIKSLKDLARGKFQTTIYSDWNSPYFLVTIGFVYGSTPPSDRGLRDIVVNLSKDHLKSLLARPEFESIMEENGDFGRDLVKASANRVDPQPDAATYALPPTSLGCLTNRLIARTIPWLGSPYQNCMRTSSHWPTNLEGG